MCNHLMYGVLHACSGRDIVAGWVHLPALPVRLGVLILGSRPRVKSSRVDGSRPRRHFLFMNLDVYYPPLPLDILEVLTRGLVERVCDGRLEEGRAAEIAVRRAWILLECGVSLPLTPADADRVYGLIHYRGL